MRGLVDRDVELGRVDALLAAAADGKGRALLVEGAAGIGKTALVDEARGRASVAGMRVLAGRGTELEGGYPLGVVRQCLLPAVQKADAGVRRRLFAGTAGRAAPVVLDGADGDEASTPFAMAHALYWLVSNLAAGGAVLFVVDDAQWADEPSLRFLAFLVRRAESLPVAVLVACRLDAERASAGTLSQVRADPATEVLVPRPLGDEGVAALLAAGGEEVSGEFARACRVATGGNPFLLGHLVAALRADGVPFTAAAASRVARVTPPEVARSVRAALSRLDVADVRLARAVAVLGDGVVLAEAAALAKLDRTEAVEAAGKLGVAGLLVDGRPLRFVHPLLRGAVTAGMTASERDDGHRRAAELLAAGGAPVEHQAIHLCVVEPTGSGQLVATLRLAAHRARDRGAPEPAVELLERALAEPPRDDLRHEILLELGYAEHAAGRDGRACEHAAQAYDLAHDPVARARALELWGPAAALDLASIAARAPLLKRVIAELSDVDRELALGLKAQAVIPFALADPDLYAELAAEARQLTGATPGEARVLGVYILRRVLDDVTGKEIADLARRAVRQTDALIASGADSRAFTGAALGLLWGDDLDAEERLVTQAIETAQRQGSAPGFASASILVAQLRRRRGLLREAEADARAGIAAGEAWTVMMACGALAASLLDQGRRADAWDTLHEGGLCESLGPAPPLTELVLTRMRVRAANGDHAGAVADWREAIGRPVQGVPKASWIENYVVASEALRATGDDEGARSLAAEALDVARRWDTPSTVGEALRGVARVEGDAHAVELLREAVEQLERSPARVAHAHALVDLGAALRRRGDRRDSRVPLHEGLELAQAGGADQLAEHAHQELAASGERVRRRTPETRDLLTASERPIAELAAGGASNAEIAQSLFVTVKTVEGHLTNSYRKLDITKRSQLAAALSSQ